MILKLNVEMVKLHYKHIQERMLAMFFIVLIP